MAQTIEAIYRNGLIEPLEKLDLPESQRLRITIEAVEEEAEEQAKEQYERAVAALKRAGARKLTPEEAEAIFGPLHPVDRKAAERASAKLGGQLSEEIIRDRGEY
jgi:predicted DNA-binding antitoxin AbrB/MazE fold protein